MNEVMACSAALVLVLPAIGDAAAPAIAHQAKDCVPSGRYARIVATAEPADGAVKAELQFRARTEGDWYAVPMSAQGRAWSAFLPRPVPPMARFEYRIVMTAADLSTAETTPITVDVAADPASCAESEIAVPAPIVVRVPAGAPLLPPVPAGFSPAGVVAAATPDPRASRKVAWITGGAIAAAGIGGALASRSEPPDFGRPQFTFFGSRPNPGSTLSLRSFLYLNLLPSAAPGMLLTFSWVVEFEGPAAEPGSASDCVVRMSGQVSGASSTVAIQLNAPLVPSAACRPPISASVGHLRITIDGTVAYDEVLDLPFTFVN